MATADTGRGQLKDVCVLVEEGMGVFAFQACVIAALVVHLSIGGLEMSQQQLNCVVGFIRMTGRFKVSVWYDNLSDGRFPDLRIRHSTLRALSSQSIYSYILNMPPKQKYPRGEEYQTLFFSKSNEVVRDILWVLSPNTTESTYNHATLTVGRHWLLVSQEIPGQREGYFLKHFSPEVATAIVSEHAVEFFASYFWNKKEQEEPIARCVQGRLVGLPIARRTTLEGIMRGITLKVDIDSLVETMDAAIAHGDRIVGGLTGEVLLTIQRYLGFDMQLQPLGTGNDSVFNRMIGRLKDLKADVSGTTIINTPARHREVDTSVPLYSAPLGYCMRRPAGNPQADTFLTPFHSGAWAAVVVYVLVATAALRYFAKQEVSISQRPPFRAPSKGSALYDPMKRVKRQTSDEREDQACALPEEDVSYWLLTVCGLIWQQGPNTHFSLASSRLLLTGCFFASFFIFSSYSTKLLAALAVRRPSYEFKTIEEAISKGWEFSSSLTTSLDDLLPSSSVPSHRIIPISHLNGSIPHKLAVAMFPELMRIGLNCSPRRKTCDSCMWAEKTSTLSFSFFFRPNFPYRKLFNYQLMRMHQSGVLQKMLRQYKPELKAAFIKCPQSDVINMSYYSMSHAELGVCFLILLLGAAAAVAVLLLEMFVSFVAGHWTLAAPS